MRLYLPSHELADLFLGMDQIGVIPQPLMKHKFVLVCECKSSVVYVILKW